MPIIKGSTPTIRIVLSTDEVDWDSLSKVYLTFAQKDAIITGADSPNTTFTKNGGGMTHDEATKSIICVKKLSQSQTLALLDDVDLDCQVDVITTGGDRKVSKVFSFGICKVLRNSQLS